MSKKRKTLRLSHSQWLTYMECKRKYKHTYLKKMTSRKRADYFVFGSAMHAALEAFYESGGSGYKRSMRKAVDQVYSEVEMGSMTVEETNNLMVQQAQVQGICEVYPEVYKEDFSEFSEFIIEEHFEINFGYHGDYDLIYHGYIDGLFRDAAGDWWVFETKTKAYNKPESKELANYVKKVHIDNQVIGYMWGARQIIKEYTGEDVFPRGIIYNVIQKPAIKRKASESNKDYRTRVREEYTVNAANKAYFLRYPLELNKKAVEMWYEEMKHTMMEIASKKTAKVKFWPMNSGACNAKWGTCQWINACTERRYNSLLYVKKQKSTEDRYEKIKSEREEKINEYKRRKAQS